MRWITRGAVVATVAILCPLGISRLTATEMAGPIDAPAPVTASVRRADPLRIDDVLHAFGHVAPSRTMRVSMPRHAAPVTDILVNEGDLVEAGRQLIQSLWDGAVEKFEEFVAWLTGIPGRIVEAIGSINLTDIINWPEPPAWWTRLTGGDGAEVSEGSSGRLEQRAKGGPISRGASYVVGEEGPELITANRNGYVHPTGEGTAAGSGGAEAGPTTVSPNFDVSINIAPTITTTERVDPAELAETIGAEMRDQVREAFRGVFADTGMRFA